MSKLTALLRKPLLSGLVALMLVSGCASTNNPRDPLEPVNRAIYQVNDTLDKVIMKPVATVYKTVLPQFVRTGVTNFFSNLYDVLTALNDLLQGKFGDALSDTGRIAGLKRSTRTQQPSKQRHTSPMTDELAVIRSDVHDAPGWLAFTQKTWEWSTEKGRAFRFDPMVAERIAKRLGAGAIVELEHTVSPIAEFMDLTKDMVKR